MKKIDLRKKTEMLVFLDGHFKYDGAFAKCVKLSHLPLNQEQRAKAWDLIGAPDVDFWPLISGPLEEFSEAFPGFAISRIGRSGGYLSISEVKQPATQWFFEYQPDYSEASMGELRCLTKMVLAFDQACDAVLELFKEVLATCSIEEQTVLLPVKTQRLICQQAI